MATYEKLIPISRPAIGKEELDEIGKVFNTHWLGLGAWVFNFEEQVKKFIDVNYVIAVNTGTTALHLALDALGIKQKDEVIVPSLTFVGSVQAIMATGATPVFCDVEKDTLNMDTDDMRNKITTKTKAIMPVHYGGLPCDMERILEIAQVKKIRVVEDAAHAFGSSYRGKKIGSFGDVTCFSFDPIKNITCGEGGAILTNDDELANTIIKKRILGIDKDTWSRYKHKRDWFYNVTTLGYRYHMSNINAAIGLVQLKKIDKFIKRKRQIVKIYDNEFQRINGIEILCRDYENTAPFNYVVKISKDRDKLMEFLKNKGIDSGVNYIPNHLQPFFGPYKISLPVTEEIWQRILSLPLYYAMNKADIEYVIDTIKYFFIKT